MPRLILAGVSPDNTPGGFYYTFLFPMLLFIVVAVVLYMLFSRPHRRVPARSISATVFGRPAGSAPSVQPSSAGLAGESDAATAQDGTAQADTGASE